MTRRGQGHGHGHGHEEHQHQDRTLRLHQPHQHLLHLLHHQNQQQHAQCQQQQRHHQQEHYCTRPRRVERAFASASSPWIAARTLDAVNDPRPRDRPPRALALHTRHLRAPSITAHEAVLSALEAQQDAALCEASSQHASVDAHNKHATHRTDARAAAGQGLFCACVRSSTSPSANLEHTPECFTDFDFTKPTHALI
eukprot:3063654-Rhodomonas_salina.3